METNQPKENKKKKPRPPLLLIHWYDAHHEFGWMDGNDEPEPVEIPLVYSIGWLMSQNEQGVRICQSWTIDNHAQTLTIPARMIEKVVEINSMDLPESLPTIKNTAKSTTRRTKNTA